MADDTPDAWITTHNAIRAQASSSFESIARS
jgi:hypothetical protein